MPTLDGLSDYGLTTPTQSSSLPKEEGGGLADFLQGNDILTEVSKKRLLEGELTKLRATETRSPLDALLKDPRGIATILAALGGIAAGGNARAAGIGGLIGAVQGAQQVAEVEASQKRRATEELEDQLDKAEVRLDKQRTRLATMFNTNPEAFVGPDGQQPDPRVLGWYMTGVDIPVFANARLRNRLNDRDWQKRFDVLNERLKSARSIPDARVLTGMLLEHIGWDNPSDDVVDSISRSAGTPEFNNTLAGHYMNYGGPSALDALIYAGENNLPLEHPDVVRRLDFSHASDVTPSQQETAKYLELLERMNQWSKDPANTQTVLQLQRESESPKEAAEKMSELAFKGEQGNIDFYKKKAGILGDLSPAELFSAYKMAADKYDLATKLGQGLAALDLPPDQLQKLVLDTSIAIMSDARQAAQTTSANRFINELNYVETQLADKLGMGRPLLTTEANKIWRGALVDVKRNPDGTIDMETFQTRVRQAVTKYIEENK